MFLILPIIWIVLMVLLTSSMTNAQKEKIKNTTYYEKVLVDGRQRTIQKFKCPSCGNKDLNYQLASSAAGTLTSKKPGGMNATFISNAKYAICNNCGDSFSTLRKPTPFINFIAAFFLSSFLCAILLILFGIISIFI